MLVPANVGALTATGATGLRLTGVLNASDVRLAAGDAFINDVGAGAINISSGRWLIYLNSPNDPHQFNGLDGNASEGATPCASMRKPPWRRIQPFQPVFEA